MWAGLYIYGGSEMQEDSGSNAIALAGGNEEKKWAKLPHVKRKGNVLNFIEFLLYEPK